MIMFQIMKIYTIKLRLANAYLLENDAGIYLVDAGAPGDADRIQKHMNQIGRSDLKVIFLTHAHIDHFGAAAELQRRTGAPIAIHKDDAPALAEAETRLGKVRGRGRLVGALLPLLEWMLPPEPVKADLLVTDGQSLAEFGLKATTLHTPGHTPGSSCLVVDGDIVFAGDLVSSTGGPHPQRYFANSWPQVEASLQRLKRARPRLTYPGHGRCPLTTEEVDGLQLDWTAQESG
jgi:glyoxylase-like metal-dependent hydrolase (beta-lactamase superfamily II)